MTTSLARRNLEAVERSIEVIESGDAARAPELIREIAHPEVEWTPLIASGVEGSYRGRERLAAFFEDFVGSFEARYDDRELRPLGDEAVLLLCRLKLRGRESGLDIDQEMGSVFEFEDGLIRRGHAYPTHAEALAAAEGASA
jgi:ketosteroid isomerase-like protein